MLQSKNKFRHSIKQKIYKHRHAVLNPEVNKWMKHHYCEAPVRSSMVKLSDILEKTQHVFPKGYIIHTLWGGEAHVHLWDRSQSRGRWDPCSWITRSGAGSWTILATQWRMKGYLWHQLQQLRQQFKMLKHQQESSLSTKKSDDQMQMMLWPDRTIFHGLDTVDNFCSFSLDAVIAVLSYHAPNVVELFQELARTDRFDQEGRAVALHEKLERSLSS